MLNKETKIRVLENFYALDHVFFGKQASEIKGLCCPALLDEYVTVKGALLSIMVEMYDLVELNPKKLMNKIQTENIKEMAKKDASIAIESCKTLVSSRKGKEDIKNIVSEAMKQNKIENVDYLIKNTIREKSMSLAVDNLLIARTLTESTEYSKLNTWEGKLLEESYKILRNDLVETALIVVDSIESNDEK